MAPSRPVLVIGRSKHERVLAREENSLEVDTLTTVNNMAIITIRQPRTV